MERSISNSIISIFLPVSKFLYFYQFRNFYIFTSFEISIFLPVSKFLYFYQFRNFYIFTSFEISGVSFHQVERRGWL